MFGIMHASNHLSAPRFGFGSGNRDTNARVHITETHSRASNMGLHSPGPVYPPMSSMGKVPDSRKENARAYSFSKDERFSSGYGATPLPISTDTNGKFSTPASKYQSTGGLGRQPLSTKRSMPNFSFGSASREQLSNVVDGESTREFGGSIVPLSPGPTVCSTKSSMANQVSSQKKSNPGWVMGSERRFRYDKHMSGGTMPAAGTYDIPGAMGKQAASTKTSLPQFSFGTGDRESLRKVYVSKDHSKDSFGMGSPGPGNLMLKSSMGLQVDSRKKSSGGWGFGSAKRFSSVGGPKGSGRGRFGPGPGAYSPQ